MPDVRTTKERILDAAEALFAKRGFANTSMRLITGTADVNLAAVNYHFGTKANLVEAVFERRLRPLNEVRVVRLERVLADQGSVREILEAFLIPAFEMLASVDERDRQFIRLLARSHTDEMAGTEHFMDRLYDDVLARFKSALGASLPDLPQPELMWRLHFVAGAVSYAMAGRDVLGIMSGDAMDDVPKMGHRLMPFLTAGLSAPIAPAPDEDAGDPGAQDAGPDDRRTGGGREAVA